MKFGVRDICDVVFKAKGAGKLGSYEYVAGQPVLYIESAKTSTLEGSATTVYATGGRGNSRLIAWEGEKTLTFTVEDALLSPIGFAILSGAGLFNASDDHVVYSHVTSNAIVDANGNIDLTDALNYGETLEKTNPIFVMVMEYGSMKEKLTVTYDDKNPAILHADQKYANKQVFVDFYVTRKKAVQELSIGVENFAGYFYVEAQTLFRRQEDGKDLAADLIFPNVKIQSNFTFNMAATGDPSTFTFTMDAMPGYTRFDRKKKVLCLMQVTSELDDDHEDRSQYLDSVNNKADELEQYPLDGYNPSVDPEAYTITLAYVDPDADRGDENSEVITTFQVTENDFTVSPDLYEAALGEKGYEISSFATMTKDPGPAYGAVFANTYSPDATISVAAIPVIYNKRTLFIKTRTV